MAGMNRERMVRWIPNPSNGERPGAHFSFFSLHVPWQKRNDFH